VSTLISGVGGEARSPLLSADAPLDARGGVGGGRVQRNAELEDRPEELERMGENRGEGHPGRFASWRIRGHSDRLSTL